MRILYKISLLIELQAFSKAVTNALFHYTSTFSPISDEFHIRNTQFVINTEK